MATIKSYTDLEQSHKLAEFLPLESADMGYLWNGTSFCDYPVSNQTIFNRIENIPCWSLTSLLNVIPKKIKDFNVLRIDISEKDFAIWYDEIGYGVNTELPDITMECPIDACYEMIIKLNELKLL